MRLCVMKTAKQDVSVCSVCLLCPLSTRVRLHRRTFPVPSGVQIDTCVSVSVSVLLDAQIQSVNTNFGGKRSLKGVLSRCIAN